MRKKALLVIGDEQVNRKRVNRSFLHFVRYAEKLKDSTLELKVLDYAQLLLGLIPTIEASLIKVIFFFPYKYWNGNIEIYQDGRTYGDKKFGQEFKTFFSKVKQAVNKYYGEKKIEYLNPPQACYLDRDKQASKDLLKISGVSTPRTLAVSSFADVQRLINRGINLYIKPRFGALGKGITYIDREKVISNFLFRRGRIISRPYDYHWRFTRIKEKKKFLNILLKKGFICEQAIAPAVFKGRRFDFRVYVIFGRVVYLYAKSSPVKFCVTNWAQGGKIDKKKIILNTLTKAEIAKLKKLAKRAAQALRLNFAGIDIIFSQDMKSAYVLEGNAFPGYEKGFDLMKCLLRFVVR